MENEQEAPIIHEYHGSQITFDQTSEDWKVTFDGKAQHHKSLQIVKNYVDRRNKKAFERVPVFVPTSDSYYNRGEGYEKAEITSVGVDGTVFIVRQGRKSAEHCGCAYVATAANEKLMKEVVETYKKLNELKETLQEKQNKIVSVNFEVLRKKALGEK